MPFAGFRPLSILLLAAAQLPTGCADIASPAPTRLVSPVSASSVALVEAAIAKGERSVDVGDWNRPPHIDLVSGGDVSASRKIAALLKENGMTARCVGFCGSALAEILLGAANCIVTPGAQVMPHLAQAVGGTAAQNNIAEIQSVAWWYMMGNGSSSRAALVQRLVNSPTKAWLMRDDELRAAGCTL